MKPVNKYDGIGLCIFVETKRKYLRKETSELFQCVKNLD
jgi:hypothetical protein